MSSFPPKVDPRNPPSVQRPGFRVQPGNQPNLWCFLLPKKRHTQLIPHYKHMCVVFFLRVFKGSFLANHQYLESCGDPMVGMKEILRSSRTLNLEGVLSFDTMPAVSVFLSFLSQTDSTHWKTNGLVSSLWKVANSCITGWLKPYK